MTGNWWRCDECGREERHPNGWQTLAPLRVNEHFSAVYCVGDRTPGSPYHLCSWSCLAKYVAKQED